MFGQDLVGVGTIFKATLVGVGITSKDNLVWAGIIFGVNLAEIIIFETNFTHYPQFF